MVDHVNPQYEHRRLDGSWASMLDQDFAADIERSYRELLAKAHSVGAKVVFATAPYLLSYLRSRNRPRPPQGRGLQLPCPCSGG